MATMNVINAAGEIETIEKPNGNGRAASNGSRPVILSEEDFAALGATNETAATSDTATAGLNGRLQRIAQRLTSLIALLPSSIGQKVKSNSLSVTLASDHSTVAVDQVSSAYDPSVSFTRPADTTAYAAGDVVGGVLTFASSGPSGKSIMILGSRFEIHRSDIPSGMTGGYRLHLYSASPPSALADNAAWDLAAGDRASYLGYLDLGAPSDFGSTLYVEQNSLNKQVRLASDALYGYLVTNSGYTPAASTAHKINLQSVAV